MLPDALCSVPARASGRAVSAFLIRLLLPVALCATPALLAAPGTAESPPRTWRLLCIGDSIVQGGGNPESWRALLLERLLAEGHSVEYIGTRKAPSRLGDLAHEGYGGASVEKVAETFLRHSATLPADFVLIHSGHNHTVEEKPIPGMLDATERIIAACRAANPRVTILIAQVITSLKLPKYAYIPEFNAALPAFARRVSTPESPVLLVDHAAGFDPAADTVADRVHPNAAGIAKLTENWHRALSRLLPSPASPPQMPEARIYRSFDDNRSPLKLHVFRPPHPGNSPAPTIVLFFGGGWSQGTPVQFFEEARRFAQRGYVAVCPDYRTSLSHTGSTPYDSVDDARAAIRFLRENAKDLGLDPRRIVALGASAGGHLTAVAGLTGATDSLPQEVVSARPDAVVLWYPVLDTGPSGYGHARVGPRFAEISPLHLAETHPLPPALILIGTQDRVTSVATARAFADRATGAGNRCDLQLFEGGIHPLFDYRSTVADNLARRDAVRERTDAFLTSLGYP